MDLESIIGKSFVLNTKLTNFWFSDWSCSIDDTYLVIFT